MTERLGPRQPVWLCTAPVRRALLGLLLLIGIAGSSFAGPAVSLSAHRLEFAPQPLGSSSDPQSVLLANIGDAPLTIGSTSLDSEDFALTAGSGGGILLPGATRTFEITYTPRNLGRRNGILMIATDAPGSPMAVGLFGQEDPRPSPRAYMSPDYGDLGFEPVGSIMGAGVLFHNVGNAPLTLRRVTVVGEHAGDFRLLEGGQPGIVPPGMNRVIRLQFQQSAYGARNALLVIESDAPGSPHTYAMSSSNPEGRTAVISPQRVEFGEQPEAPPRARRRPSRSRTRAQSRSTSTASPSEAPESRSSRS
jgi:hypothetical protein